MNQHKEMLNFKCNLIECQKNNIRFFKENEEKIISLFKRTIALENTVDYSELKKIINTHLTIDTRYSCFDVNNEDVKMIIIVDQVDFLQSVSIDFNLLIDDSPLSKKGKL